jgi:hypothetical protein
MLFSNALLVDTGDNQAWFLSPLSEKKTQLTIF